MLKRDCNQCSLAEIFLDSGSNIKKNTELYLKMFSWTPKKVWCYIINTGQNIRKRTAIEH